MGDANENEKERKYGEFINFAEIGGIWNMHHWLGGADAPVHLCLLCSNSSACESAKMLFQLLLD